jgi:hypothetical protein
MGVLMGSLFRSYSKAFESARPQTLQQSAARIKLRQRADREPETRAFSEGQDIPMYGY